MIPVSASQEKFMKKFSAYLVYSSQLGTEDSS